MRWTSNPQSIKNYIEQMTEELKNAMPEASGALKDSVTTKVEVSNVGYGYSVDYYMYDYGTYMDAGVNGKNQNWGSPYTFKKMPPAKVFDKWIVMKGIAPRDGRGRLMPRKQISWMIARSVFNKGLKPHNFTKVIDNKLNGLADLTAFEIWYDLKYKIEKI